MGSETLSSFESGYSSSTSNHYRVGRTKEITSEAESYTYTRNTATEVYAQIKNDLLDAEKLLPAKYTGTNIGRATSGAAKSLLGKVYVQEKKYAEAAAKLAEVINSGTYRILPNLADMFGVGKDNNDEIVFAVRYVSSGFGEGNSYVYVFAPGNSGTQFVGVTAGGPTLVRRTYMTPLGLAIFAGTRFWVCINLAGMP